MRWSAITTKAGINLLTKVPNRKFTFTRAVCSSNIVDSNLLYDQTDITNVEKTLSITSIENVDNNVKLRLQLTNIDVSKNFELSQIGIFAKVDDEEEVLFMLIQTDIPDMIPAFNQSNNFINDYIINTYIGNAESVEGVFDTTGFATALQVQEIFTDLNSHTKNTSNPHNVTKEQIGLPNLVDGSLSSSITSTSTTTYANSNAVKLVNDKTIANQSDIESLQSNIGKTLPIYDVVIKTQEQFDELIASTTWLDAKSVALIGSFTCAKSLIVPANVVQIDGFNNCTIDYTLTGSSTTSYLIKGTNMSSNSSISNIMVKCWTTRDSYGFYECKNLTNCVANNGSSSQTGYGFGNCTNLINCVTKIQTKGPGTYSRMTGFDNCTNLINCTADKYSSARAGSSSLGFNNCTNLTNCIANNANGGGTNAGFIYCSNLNNCIVSASFDGNDYFSFHTCTNLTDCTSKCDAVVITSFYNCNLLVNCSANDTATHGNCYNFQKCNDLTNCSANNKSTNTSSSNFCYGFSDCTNLTNCATTNNKGTGFRNCNLLMNCTANNSEGNGFNSCEKLTNCIANNASISSFGFHSCTNLTHCTANNTETSQNFSTYGFIICTNLTACTANNIGISNNYGFSTCSYVNGARKGSDFIGTLWIDTNLKRDDTTCDLE